MVSDTIESRPGKPRRGQSNPTFSGRLRHAVAPTAGVACAAGKTGRKSPMKARLVSKNVTINGRRTSLRLEQASWEALTDICKCEGLTLHELCSLVDNNRHGSSRTSAVRAFIVTYFRTLARDHGALVGGTASAILPGLASRR
jgi:predicted DNA-binding ribbon-helix-helix protein